MDIRILALMLTPIVLIVLAATLMRGPLPSRRAYWEAQRAKEISQLRLILTEIERTGPGARR
jgi:hypothetical protein